MNVQRRSADGSHCKATYQDVLDSPLHMVAEVLAGTLHALPRPAMRHAWASSRLGGRLDRPFGPDGSDPGGWWIVDEPELHLGDDIVVPDLAGWKRETMPEYPDAAYCAIVPDWACEVLSPSTRRIDLKEKRTIYARECVSHLWFVDPDARTLESFALRDGQWVLLATLADDASVALPPFDAISFPLDALWPAGATADDDAAG
ncbi:MAG: Uma2 family endonuclease [Boseongicola sp.]|nr:Uma2 family endonuclease [Boseongicola sp.]